MKTSVVGKILAHASTSKASCNYQDFLNLKLFDYGKASVKKAYKVISVGIFGVFLFILKLYCYDVDFVSFSDPGL